MKDVSLGLQMALVVNLAKHGAFINELSAICSVVKTAIAVELGDTERNEQQRTSRLALEILKLNNMAKNNLLFNEMGKLEKAWRNFGGRSHEGWALGDRLGGMCRWLVLGRIWAASPSLPSSSDPTQQVRVPVLAPAHGGAVTSGRNSENSTGNVLELERLIYAAMLTVSYVHSLAKHRSRHGMRSSREIRQERAVIWKPEVLVRKKGYFRWWEI